MESDLFCFFIPGEENQIFPGASLWEMPLSGNKTGDSSDITSEPGIQNSAVTIGDYFLACRRFLSKNNFLVLKTGLEDVLNRPVLPDQIDRIIVFLEKHGAFYHPLKIQVELKKGFICSFVMNGAVSRPGLTLIENEYQLISRLNKAFSKCYLPRVFGVDVIKTDKGRMGFFLGEWFEGYREFHVTEGHNGGQVVIWESDGSCHHISEASALPIYREISRILTHYYDIETFEQIFPWHHAAGDFIVRQEGDNIHVRLITARGYAPLVEFDASSEDKTMYILPSLWFFFLNLALRMRLDRLNGTGRAVMLGKNAIKVVVEGFLCGLDEKSVIHDFGDLRLIFLKFCKQFSLDQIMGSMENMLESCHPDPAENKVIEENFESHCKTLHSILKNL